MKTKRENKVWKTGKRMQMYYGAKFTALTWRTQGKSIKFGYNKMLHTSDITINKGARTHAHTHVPTLPAHSCG